MAAYSHYEKACMVVFYVASRPCCQALSITSLHPETLSEVAGILEHYSMAANNYEKDICLCFTLLCTCMLPGTVHCITAS